MNIQTFFAAGKLLLFGEYLVLRGAKALAVPVRFGQQLQIKYSDSENIFWKSFERGKQWLTIEFTPALDIVHTDRRPKADIARRLLHTIRDEIPDIIESGLHLRFDIDFDRNYGLGTSSTLISLLAQWSGVNPFLLQKKIFDGSGYDVAAATAKGPFIYQVSEKDVSGPTIIPVKISEKISSNLLFIYSGKKQNSSTEVSSFLQTGTTKQQRREINRIVEKAFVCDAIEEFEMLMVQSETLLSKILQRPAIQENMFSDYPFPVKSLGAWGGDFIMATFREQSEALKYFRQKGLSPVFSYKQLIKNGR